MCSFMKYIRRKVLKKGTPEWQKYHSNFHTSTVELAKMAAEARPKLLILYHQLPMGVTPEKLMSEIKELYDGKVVYGNDLDVF